jgi:hypothetical protein
MVLMVIQILTVNFIQLFILKIFVMKLSHKHKIGYAVLLAFPISVISCISAKDPFPDKEALTNAVTKNWFDSNCSRCHSAGKIAEKDWLYDATDYQASIKAHLSTIYQEVVTEAVMPEDKPLSAADMTAFKKWYDAGASSK